MFVKILSLQFLDIIFIKFLVATIGVGAIMVTMTLVTIPLMDRMGRRTLHLIGLAGHWQAKKVMLNKKSSKVKVCKVL